MKHVMMLLVMMLLVMMSPQVAGVRRPRSSPHVRLCRPLTQVESALESLEEAGCVTLSGRDGDGGLDGEGDVVAGTTLGRIASFYYLDHHTMSQFVASMAADLEFTELLQVRGVTPVCVRL